MVSDDRVQRPERRPQLLEVPVLGEALGRAVDVAARPCRRSSPRPARAGRRPRAPGGARRRSPRAGGSSRRRTSGCSCGSRSSGARPGACAEAIAPVTRLFSIGTSSGIFRAVQDPVDPVGLEQPHQVVLEREVEPGLTRVALAAGPAAQLVVDPARLVPLGADDVEAAGLVDLVVLGLRPAPSSSPAPRARRLRTRRSARPGRAPAGAARGRRGTPRCRRA